MAPSRGEPGYRFQNTIKWHSNIKPRLQIMKIPSETQCYRIMAEMAMLDNIVAHSIRVCQVATLLTDSLNSKGYELNRSLVRAAALLHDITKTRSIDTGENHAHTGALYLKELEFPEVGDIVGQHVNLADFHSEREPIEAEVVNYADKRVLHDQVVSLEDRMDYIMVRYSCSSGELGSRLEQMRREAGLIENKLFKTIPFSAAKLTDHLNADDFKNQMVLYQEAIQDHLDIPT
jgi:uncharacterized protein